MVWIARLPETTAIEAFRKIVLAGIGNRNIVKALL